MDNTDQAAEIYAAKRAAFQDELNVAQQCGQDCSYWFGVIADHDKQERARLDKLAAPKGAVTGQPESGTTYGE